MPTAKSRSCRVIRERGAEDVSSALFSFVVSGD